MTKSRVNVLAVFSVAAVAVTFACNSSSDAPVQPARTFTPAAARLKVTPAVVGKIRAAEARNEWVAQIHTAAIREAIDERRTWSKADQKNRDRVCEQAMRLGFKYAAKANVAAGLPAGSRGDHLPSVVAALRSTERCKDRISNLFTASEANAKHSFAPTSHSPELRSAMERLQAAFGGSGLSGASIAVAMQNVIVDAAATLSESEFDLLIAQTRFSVSSINEWQAQWDSGDWIGRRAGADPMSIFSRAKQWGLVDIVIAGFDLYYYFSYHESAQTVALADLAGFLAGLSGGLASAVAWGAIGSLTAY